MVCDSNFRVLCSSFSWKVFNAGVNRSTLCQKGKNNCLSLKCTISNLPNCPHLYHMLGIHSCNHNTEKNTSFDTYACICYNNLLFVCSEMWQALDLEPDSFKKKQNISSYKREEAYCKQEFCIHCILLLLHYSRHILTYSFFGDMNRQALMIQDTHRLMTWDQNLLCTIMDPSSCDQ